MLFEILLTTYCTPTSSGHIMTYIIDPLGEFIVGDLPDNTVWHYNSVIGRQMSVSGIPEV